MSNMTDNPSSSTLSVKVFEELEKRIISGEYAPGDSLIELKLSKELGVSRTPIREAIRMLEQKDLVKIVPNKGACVLGVDYQDLLDIYTIRSYIEGLAAKWAAENVSDEEIKELNEIVDLQEFYLIKNQIDQINDLDTRFHEKIFDFCQSRTLQRMLTELHHMIKHFRKISILADGRAEKAIAEHRVICTAISQRDPEKAEQAAVQHITNAKENLMTLWNQEK